MRKLLLITLALGFGVPVQADIQAPPGSKYTSSRKLGRAIGNILYGVVEIPEQIVRKTEADGSKAGWSHGVVDGTRRAFKRIGYGFVTKHRVQTSVLPALMFQEHVDRHIVWHVITGEPTRGIETGYLSERVAQIK